MIEKIFSINSYLCVKFSPIINRFFLRKKGCSFGKNMTIIGKVSIRGTGHISIGENFIMTSGYHINPVSANLQGAIYTDNPKAQIIIGNNVGMNSTRIRIHDSLTIGNNVKIGGGVLLIDTDSHPIDYVARRISNDATKYAPIVIEDDVWIGAQSIILKGVTIGARSIIGAGSVVTKNIPADCVAGGNPCKVIKYLNRDDRNFVETNLTI